MPSAKAIVPPEANSWPHRIAITLVILGLLNLLIYAFQRLTGIPLFDIVRILMHLSGEQELEKSHPGLLLQLISFGVVQSALWSLIDKFVSKNLAFFLFSGKSKALAVVPEELSAHADWNTLKASHTTDCATLENWLFQDAESRHWARWWHRGAKERCSVNPLAFHGPGKPERNAMAGAIIDHVQRGEGRPGSLGTLWRIAGVWHPLKDRRLAWDVGTFHDHRKNNALAKRIADWRPRRPTLIVIFDDGSSRPAKLLELLNENSDAYFYPVHLLTLTTPDYPDVLASLGSVSGSVTYRMEEFTGREWFTRHIVHQIDGIRRPGGVIMLEAPAGWGKTALALNWVKTANVWLDEQGKPGRGNWKAARNAAPEGDKLLVDGWAFARKFASARDEYLGLSTDVKDVIRQLDACTRDRLELPHDSPAPSDAQEMFRQLLKACRTCGEERGHPVILLLDGIDELNVNEENLIEQIEHYLPWPWPEHVVLIMLLRTVDGDANRYKLRRLLRERPIRRLDVTLDAREPHEREAQVEARKENEADIRAYIKGRLDALGMKYRVNLNTPAFREALWKASQGYFIVASGLLSMSGEGSWDEQQKELRGRLINWRDHPEAGLPNGPIVFFEQLIDRKMILLEHCFDRMVPNADAFSQPDPKKVGYGLLALIATRRGTQTPGEFLGMLGVLREACQQNSEGATRAWIEVWDTSPIQGPSNQQFSEALNALHGLFANDESSREHEGHKRVREHSYIDADVKLNFSHYWLANIVHGYISKQNLTASIAAIWAELCKHQIAGLRSGATDRATQYVEAHGIEHLLDAKEISAALALRTVMADRWQQRGNAHQKLAGSSVRIARAIDDAVNRPGDPRAVSALRQIVPDDLLALLRSRVYLTGLYTAVIETMVSCHVTGWDGWDAALVELVRNSDIVFRHDVGEAYAAVWGKTGMRASVERDICAMMVFDAQAADTDLDIVAYKREIAGYALKFIWRTAESYADGLGHFDPAIIALYGNSESCVDRMIASELLLSYAIGTGNDPSPFVPEKLRKSRWKYHESDILDLHYVVASDKEALRDGEDVPAALRQRANEHLSVDEERRQLLGKKFVKEHEELLTLLQEDAYRQQLNGAYTSLPCALEVLANVLAVPLSPDRRTAIRIIRVLLSHPLWHVMESVSAALSEIVTGAEENRSLLMELLKDPWWRVRYGALDASFNVGNDDRFASFRQALVHLMKANESHSRVLGLCGDDFLGWIRDGAADDDERRSILADRDIRKMVQGWVQTADDSWLLEYVYLLFSYLHKAGLSFSDLLLPDVKWSRYLRGASPFWTCGHSEFLARIEQIPMKSARSAKAA
jgi:hypothetical protein